MGSLPLFKRKFYWNWDVAYLTSIEDSFLIIWRSLLCTRSSHVSLVEYFWFNFSCLNGVVLCLGLPNDTNSHIIENCCIPAFGFLWAKRYVMLKKQLPYLTILAKLLNIHFNSLEDYNLNLANICSKFLPTTCKSLIKIAISLT